MNTTTLENDMPYHFIPNTNHDLVVIECGPARDCVVDVFEVREYPIIGWRIEEGPEGGWLDSPIPVAAGWFEPEYLMSSEWGVLDKRQGIVQILDDGPCPVGAWKERQERLFTKHHPAREENATKFAMTYAEREQLKQFAGEGKNLHETLTMIAHWMRQAEAVPFSDYAANWAAAEQRKDVEAMRQQWPLTGPRMIADNCSDWGSFGHPGYVRPRRG
ncbi:hypothetical protein [Azotobacter beijerinckii]|uniref:hypothetical protein n=1 Tax=Azotobacter beijerinckii TaxID=170623 RepID=UPI0029530BAA|nr:hypothetical protein [Azotobacter beijerinckii]MDV7210483.1 hypothetical protein [Azotobacter beijerinckii]